MTKKICELCGNEFEPSKFAPKKKYCSDRCQRKAYMRKYNKEGARRRGALAKENCPMCGSLSKNWYKNEEFGRVCAVCNEKLKTGKPVVSELFSDSGARFYGRDWWIGRQISKFTVLDIPFEPLCNGPSTETKVKIRCNRGHEFEQEVCNIGTNCKMCVEESEKKQAEFKKMEVPEVASFEDWKQIIESNTDLKLLSASEDYLTKGQDIRVKMECWCGRVWEPRWNDVVSKRIVSCGCVNRASKPVELIEQHIKDRGFTVEREKPVEEFQADIYVVEKNLVIEFDGLRWHKNINDYRKYNTYKKYLYNYIGIYEDVWESDRNRVFKIIDNALGVCQPKIVPDSELSYDMDSEDDWRSYRLTDGSNLVAIDIDKCGKILSFKRTYTNDFFLFEKLWASIKEVQDGPFVVDLDNRTNDKNLFSMLGFIKEKDLEPKSYWVKDRKRIEDNGEDVKGMEEKGWYKLYDSGWTRYKHE